jgi:preprotein translocase subunit SecE
MLGKEFFSAHMNTKVDTSPGILDTLKLVLAAVALIGGVVAYYYYEDASLLLRVAGVLVAFGLGAVIAFQSMQGKELWRFIQSSRGEIRKVVWPNRQETLQTTLTVMVFALLMGVFFWLLDLFLLWATRLVTGQGG